MSHSWHIEPHFSQRNNWLRASVLGANDGLISTASLLIGLAAARPDASTILITGVAALVGGAVSMAAGEYVSVSSQADTEKSDLIKEARELERNPDKELAELTRILCDIESVSGEEKHLADRIEATLATAPHLEVIRHGNTVAARTNTAAPQRVLIAGHIDTVPVSGCLPARLDEESLWGRGSVDMKGGVASHLIHAMNNEPARHDVTWVFYDQEEVYAEKIPKGLRLWMCSRKLPL